jgi:hypothetical protein
MSDSLQRSMASLDTPWSDTTLSCTENTATNIYLVQSNYRYNIDEVAAVIMGQHIALGHMITGRDMRMLQLMPNRAFLLFESSLPDSVFEFRTQLTDIGHGMTELCISGDMPLEFLNAYCSVDIKRSSIRQVKTVSTRLGHYSVFLWWDNESEIHILLERSYARSFRDYLAALAMRFEACQS